MSGDDTTAANIPFSLDASKEDLRGSVRTRFSAGAYTYLEVAPETGLPRWVVLLGQSARVGQTVEVAIYGTKAPFTSKRLHRDFASVGFGRLITASTTDARVP